MTRLDRNPSLRGAQRRRNPRAERRDLWPATRTAGPVLLRRAAWAQPPHRLWWTHRTSVLGRHAAFSELRESAVRFTARSDQNFCAAAKWPSGPIS